MAVYIRHGPCPRCGSRDNLAHYSDGSGWCFGCHAYFPADNSGGIHGSEPVVPISHVEEDYNVRLPDDCSDHYPRYVVEWLSRYGIGVHEGLKHGWKYSAFFDQLIYPFYQNGELKAFQARNFNSGRAALRKYFTKGSVQDILPIFHGAGEVRGGTLVVVEDVLSATKVGRQCDAHPCLGCYLPARKLVELKNAYDTLIVWLDSDKFKEGRGIADMGKWLGMKTHTMYTLLDPKEHSDAEIREYLKL